MHCKTEIVSTYKIFSGMKDVKTYAYVNEIPKMNFYTSEDKSSYMFSFAAAWGKKRSVFCAKLKASHHIFVEIITHIPHSDC